MEINISFTCYILYSFITQICVDYGRGAKPIKVAELMPSGSWSIPDKTSYCKISQCLEAARFVLRIVQSLWNLTGTLAAVLPKCLSQISKRYDDLNYQPRILETSRDLTIRRHHDDVIKWRHFSRNWPFVRGIHRSPVNSPHKSQWRGALIFSLICDWINGWVKKREAGGWRRHRAHYDVVVMKLLWILVCYDYKCVNMTRGTHL